MFHIPFWSPVNMHRGAMKGAVRWKQQHGETRRGAQGPINQSSALIQTHIQRFQIQIFCKSIYTQAFKLKFKFKIKMLKRPWVCYVAGGGKKSTLNLNSSIKFHHWCCYKWSKCLNESWQLGGVKSLYLIVVNWWFLCCLASFAPQRGSHTEVNNAHSQKHTVAVDGIQFCKNHLYLKPFK